MLVKSIVDEDFLNYKIPSIFIATCYCDWKCCNEQNVSTEICQNSELFSQKNVDIPINEIFNRYINNPITKAIIIGGLEPMLQFEEVFLLIKYFRENNCNDAFVIYTGYYENEISRQISILKQYTNIIVKFGRYILNSNRKFDDVLGIELASENQFAKIIS
jgi:organic radical activating enzyme